MICFLISAVGWILFPQLAQIRFFCWPIFISSVGKKYKPDVRMIRNKQVLTKGKGDNNGV